MHACVQSNHQVNATCICPHKYNWTYICVIISSLDLPLHSALTCTKQPASISVASTFRNSIRHNHSLLSDHDVVHRYNTEIYPIASVLYVFQHVCFSSRDVLPTCCEALQELAEHHIHSDVTFLPDLIGGLLVQGGPHKECRHLPLHSCTPQAHGFFLQHGSNLHPPGQKMHESPRSHLEMCLEHLPRHKVKKLLTRGATNLSDV